MSLHPTVPAPAVRSKLRLRDILTVGLLLGAVLLLVAPFGVVWATVAWAAGAGLLWSSATWNSRDKAIGTLVWPGGLIGPVLLLTSVGQVCTTTQGDAGAVGETVCTGFALSPWVGLPLAVIAVAAPLAVAAYLLQPGWQVTPRG